MANELFTGKNTLLLMVGGALGALGLMQLAKSESTRPFLVGAAKEGVALKEWLEAHYEKVKEDFEDIVAEGAYEHESEAAAQRDAQEKETELVTKIEELLAKIKEKQEE